MLNKTILLITILVINWAHAETCPKVSDIKDENFKGWQPININSGMPATLAQLDIFKKNVDRFALAGWMDDMIEGPNVCYYDAESHDEDYLGVVFTKIGGKPDKNSGYWQEVDFNIMRCEASIENCRFEDA